MKRTLLFRRFSPVHTFGLLLAAAHVDPTGRVPHPAIRGVPSASRRSLISHQLYSRPF
jgi:hypothetical protein